jgi:hypothetical protein
MTSPKPQRPHIDATSADADSEFQLLALPQDYREIIRELLSGVRDSSLQPTLGHEFSESEQDLLSQVAKFKIDKHSQDVFIDTCTTIIGRCQLREEAAKQTATRLEYQVRGLFHIAFEHLAMFHEDAASFLKEQKKIVSDPTISDSNKAVRIQEMRSAFSTDSLDSFNSEKIAGAISRAVESSVRSIQNISGAATTHELNFLTHYVNNSLVALLKDLKTRADEVRGYEEPRASTSFK